MTQIENDVVKPLKSVVYKRYVDSIYRLSSMWFGEGGMGTVRGQKFEKSINICVSIDYI